MIELKIIENRNKYKLHIFSFTLEDLKWDKLYVTQIAFKPKKVNLNK